MRVFKPCKTSKSSFARMVSLAEALRLQIAALPRKSAPRKLVIVEFKSGVVLRAKIGIIFLERRRELQFILIVRSASLTATS